MQQHNLIYHVAMDILPVHASAVPSEHIFSSSKETDTLWCSNLSPGMMEILQISFKTEKLNFNNGWITQEPDEISVIDVPCSTAHKLLTTGQVEELTQILCQGKSWND